MPDPEEFLRFWQDDIGEDRWYVSSPEQDDEIRARYGAVWEAIETGQRPAWGDRPRSLLALIILADQVPRNIHRGSARAFATDRVARRKARIALDRGWDTRIDGALRQFFYMPLVHSECLSDQERGVCLFRLRMPEAADNLLHARAHREVIRMFGRFPTRNADMGRVSTHAERAFLDNGGYGAVVAQLKAA